MANDMDLDPGFDDGGRPERSDVVRVAREKVSTPATLLIAASIFMFASSIFGFWLNFGSGIDINEKMITWMRDNSADKKMKDEFQKQLDQRQAQDKTLEKAMSGVFGTLGMIGNCLVLMAGLMMKKLKSWGLCLTGSIFAIVMNGCCCVGMPLGIWALIVLSNRDVKAGFEVAKKMG